MALTRKQAVAILILQQHWYWFKDMAAQKGVNLMELLGAAEQEITQEGIQLLRRYEVAAAHMLPRGIPKREDIARKQHFMTQTIQCMKDLHESAMLDRLEQTAAQLLDKRRLNAFLDTLELQTPLAKTFLRIIQKKIPEFKLVNDLKNTLRVLITKYSLTQILEKHYEEQANYRYYKQQKSFQQHLQRDFDKLSLHLLQFAP